MTTAFQVGDLVAVWPAKDAIHLYRIREIQGDFAHLTPVVSCAYNINVTIKDRLVNLYPVTPNYFIQFIECNTRFFHFAEKSA